MDPEPPGGGVPDEDVLGDGQVREQPRLLVDHGDAEGASLGRDRGSGPSAPSRRDGPAVRLMDAGQDLDQRALAGAVLADERVDLAGDEVERDVVERLGRGEALGDPAQLGAWRGCDRPAVSVHRREPAAVSPWSAPVEPRADSMPRPMRASTIVRGAPSSVMTMSIRSSGQNVAKAARLPFRVIDDGDDLARRGDHRLA